MNSSDEEYSFSDNEEFPPVKASTKQFQFVKEVSSEKKRLQSFKYSIYIKVSGIQWAYIILNTNGEKKAYSGESPHSNEDRCYLIALVHGIKSILQSYSMDELKFIKISCYITSVYCMNVCKEWINLWKKDKFINRPNLDYLQQLSEYIDNSHIEFIYIVSNPTSVQKELNAPFCN